MATPAAETAMTAIAITAMAIAKAMKAVSAAESAATAALKNSSSSRNEIRENRDNDTFLFFATRRRYEKSRLSTLALGVAAAEAELDGGADELVLHVRRQRDLRQPAAHLVVNEAIRRREGGAANCKAEEPYQ